MVKSSRLLLSLKDFTRAVFWRLGRSMYRTARGDTANRPDTNGEYWLLNELLQPRTTPFIAFDIGANNGDWCVRALDLSMEANIDLIVYAFEPSAVTRSILTKRLEGHTNVRISGDAVSSEQGESWFYRANHGSGTSSLSSVSGSVREMVRKVTLDGFIAQEGISRVDMVKVDVEGFDFEVLKGAEQSLAHGVIEVMQFEYNWRWLINHAALRDVFQFVKGKPYRVGKLTGKSIEVFDEWHFELDRYFENNYLLIRNGSPLLNLAERMRFDISNCPRRTGHLSVSSQSSG